MDDLISRQAAIDVVNGIDSHFVKYIEALPSAQPEPLTVNFAREMDRETIEKLKEGLKNAPVLIMEVNDSAQSEHKKGKWIIRETAFEDTEAKCSVCGFVTLVNEPGNGLHMVSDLNFCPKCGSFNVSDMGGEQGEAD